MPRLRTHRVIVAEVQQCLKGFVRLIPVECDLGREGLEDGFINTDGTLDLG